MTVQAVEFVCALEGESSPHLIRCSDGNYYVVKFQNNCQGTRVLANELLAARLAEKLSLPVFPSAVVEVGEKLIRDTDDAVVRSFGGFARCQAGMCFGSLLDDIDEITGGRRFSVFHKIGVYPFSKLENFADFLGMLVFDKWTSNTDGRQYMLARRNRASNFRAVMIDNGNCFGAQGWYFRDTPLRGLLSEPPGAYGKVEGIEAFEPWLTQLETHMTEEAIVNIANEIPMEWYGNDPFAMIQLARMLSRRRQKIRSLLLETRSVFPQRFPLWTASDGGPKAFAAP